MVFIYLSILAPEKMEISAGKPNYKAVGITTCPRYGYGCTIEWAFSYE